MEPVTPGKEAVNGSLDPHVQNLVREAQRRAPLDFARILLLESDETVAAVLRQLHQAPAYRILLRFPKDRREAVVQYTGDHMGDPWKDAQQYPENSVGRLMEPPVAVFAPDTRVDRAVEMIREWTHDTLITYGYIVDRENKLTGIVAMRDLLLAGPDDTLQDVMLLQPFSLRPDEAVGDAMKEVVYRHYPLYPVCDAEGHLLGVVQGFMLFEHQNFELSAQYGSMVGVDKEEHAETGWVSAFRMRHPWLQINLLTAFLAAFVVSLFEDTIAQVVVLAAFLPVLAGQSGNTGCQALAVAIRAITLNELKPGSVRRVLYKETMLGLANGIVVGIVAGIAMYFYAAHAEASEPMVLGIVVFLAMTGSCLASGVSGIMVPLTLKKCGADPAMASSIFLTTATDVVSMGLFLWLANSLVLN
ncbi:MAG TPA: magnesium transporter [Xanthomonadales bacterium]|nr:magnesium transporter [Xanthomonadales bacterium]